MLPSFSCKFFSVPVSYSTSQSLNVLTPFFLSVLFNFIIYFSFFPLHLPLSVLDLFLLLLFLLCSFTPSLTLLFSNSPLFFLLIFPSLTLLFFLSFSYFTVSIYVVRFLFILSYFFLLIFSLLISFLAFCFFSVSEFLLLYFISLFLRPTIIRWVH